MHRHPRINRLNSHLVGTAAAALEPPWDLPQPVDFPPSVKPLPDKADADTGNIPCRISISADFQREFLLRTAIEGDAFQGTTDPSFVSSMLNAVMTQRLYKAPSSSAYKPKSGSFGSVHVSDRVTMNRPLVPGEDLIISVDSTKELPHPKGTLTESDVSVVDCNGSEIISILRQSLDLAPPSNSAQGSPKKKESDPRVGAKVSSTQFTPDMVAGYCYFVTNRIHNEIETAQAFGYKAPIWAGTQGMHLTMQHLYTFGVPQTMVADFTFKRPVFWEDKIDLYYEASGRTGSGTYNLVNADTGKLAMSMVVHEATFAYPWLLELPSAL